MATTEQENEALVRRFFTTVYDDHRTDDTTGFLAADANIQNGMHSWGGLEEYRAYMEPAFQAFPDYSLTIEELFAAGDTVAFRFTDSETMEGEYQGKPPTGEEFSLSVIGIATVEDGKITELRYGYDRLQMMQHLGLLPESA